MPRESSNTESLDREAVESLARDFLIAVRIHYLARPTGRERVYEILNACGIVAAITIAGCGDDRKVRDFLDLAIDQEIADLHGRGLRN